MLGQYGLETRSIDFTVLILDNSLLRDSGFGQDCAAFAARECCSASRLVSVDFARKPNTATGEMPHKGRFPVGDQILSNPAHKTGISFRVRLRLSDRVFDARVSFSGS
jgi:hypothetical protein